MTLQRIAVSAIKRLMTGIAAAAAVVVLFQFVGVVLERITYPFDLEWMESGVVTHVRRVLEGKPLYGPPSLEFTAFIYPPLYYYVSAVASSLFGLSHFALRLVSVLSILGTFVLIARWARRESGDTLAGFIAVAAFCACYSVSEYWYDVARVDSLFMLLLLGGWTMVREAASPRQALVAGVLLALACLTKQTATPYAAAAVALLFLRAPKLSLFAAGALCGLLLASVLWLNASSQGHFWYYVVDMPSRHEIDWPRWREAFREQFWTPAAPMLLAGGALLFGAGFQRHQRWAWAFNAVFTVVAVNMSMTSLLKTGGYVNALMPAYAALSIAFGIELAALRRSAGFSLGPAGAYALATAAFLGQLGLLSYDQEPAPPDLAKNTRPPVPTREDYEAGLRMRARLATLPEPLWVTTSSELSRANGHAGAFTHNMGIVDVMKAGGRPGEKVRAELAQAIATKEFSCIVTDRAIGFLTIDYLDLIRQHYRPAGTVMANEPLTAFWPRSGAWLRPDEIWVPK